MPLTDLHPASLRWPIVAAAALVADDVDARAAAPADSYGYCPYGDVGYAPTSGSYYDYCGNQEILYDLLPQNADAIPTDGVLVLQAVTSNVYDPVNALAKIDATITQAGNPVPGALETTQVPQRLLWRPAAPLTAGAVYDFAATISNPVAPVACVEPAVQVAFAFTASDQATAMLEPSTLSGTAMLVEVPRISLETLACCPGVSPSVNNSGCGAPVVSFDETQCTPLVADGSLAVDLTGTPAAQPPTAGQVHYTLNVDGAPLLVGYSEPHFQTSIAKPFCATVTATDDATGASVTGPMACYGNDVAAQLGEHAIDPPPSFTCSLRQCELTADGWDLDACTPLDPNHPNEPVDDGKGCGCAATDPSAPALLLGLAGLLAARRRRTSTP